MSRQTGDVRPGRPDRSQGPGGPGQEPTFRWAMIALFVLVVAVLVLPPLLGDPARTEMSYGELIRKVNESNVAEATVNNDSGRVTGELKDGTRFTVDGPRPLPDADNAVLRDKVPELHFDNTQPNFFASLLPLLLPVGLLIGFFVWMNRRAQGQMSGIMSIGRSKAKVYTTERPKTTFSDVAGYEGVKQEIREVVDFLKSKERFKEIGARIPKGVLLVGPPGTGKTLLARAVAGEAGVPFLSVTGSDFMEMFVGVGASRVRDLFQTARKQAPAIIFVDEVDSIGRKRGAGLGGGHDEREQTLNQMLSEMDGFEATEGIVMMAVSYTHLTLPTTERV